MHLFCYFVVVAYICHQTLGFLQSYNCDLDCNHHGTCHYNSRGGKYCRCNSGYSGDKCQTSCNLDCNHHGTCHHGSHGQYCRCNGGYTGNRCETGGDGCHPNPCQHFGHCENVNTSPYFKCTCNFGRLGETCEQDHCTSSPCKNGGICHRTYSGSFYHCDCKNSFVGDNCDIAPASNSLPPVPATSTVQVTTTSLPAATTVPNIKQSCSKISAVFDIAEKVVESNQAAAVCQSGNHSSPEAFVLNNCGLTSASTWKQGYNVMTWCRSIPPYTPVATFQQGTYDSTKHIAGIFIGCLQDSKGFTFSIQTCDQVAHIDHIIVGNDTLNRNPNNYFTIEL